MGSSDWRVVVNRDGHPSAIRPAHRAAMGHGAAASGPEHRSRNQHGRAHLASQSPRRAPGCRAVAPHSDRTQPPLNHAGTSGRHTPPTDDRADTALTWPNTSWNKSLAAARPAGPISAATDGPDHFTWRLTLGFTWWQVLGSNQRRLSRRFYRPAGGTAVTCANATVESDLGTHWTCSWLVAVATLRFREPASS